MEPKINIAIDGFSSCGKSTLAKSLAKRLKYRYIDTGSMYRAVGLYALQHQLVDSKQDLLVDKITAVLHQVEVGFELNPQTHQSELYLNGMPIGDSIRTIQIADLASQVSKLRPVRDKLQTLQKAFALQQGVIMDGRDIGTVVMPNADLKIFMTAEKKIRAERRFKELQERGKPIPFEEVLQRLEKRDYDDVHRAEDPLLQANDAIVLDNSHLSQQEQLDFVLEKVQTIVQGKIKKPNS